MPYVSFCIFGLHNLIIFRIFKAICNENHAKGKRKIHQSLKFIWKLFNDGRGGEAPSFTQIEISKRLITGIPVEKRKH